MVSEGAAGVTDVRKPVVLPVEVCGTVDGMALDVETDSVFASVAFTVDCSVVVAADWVVTGSVDMTVVIIAGSVDSVDVEIVVVLGGSDVEGAKLDIEVMLSVTIVVNLDSAVVGLV